MKASLVETEGISSNCYTLSQNITTRYRIISLKRDGHYTHPRIKNAQFFSIICDEASSGTTEFMSLVLRFVCPDTKKIEEQFLTFQHVTKCTGRLLGERILKTIDDLGLDITRCRGQGYDGAAAMSSDACGVQATVKEVAPLAAYMHCASHCLNLVIVHSCRVLSVKNVIDKISSVSVK